MLRSDSCMKHAFSERTEVPVTLYVMSFATVDDPGAAREYIPRAHDIIESFGGEIVIRGRYEETLEGLFEPSGRPPTTGVVQRWQDREALNRMLTSPQYADLRAYRAGIMTPTVALLSEMVDGGESGK